MASFSRLTAAVHRPQIPQNFSLPVSQLTRHQSNTIVVSLKLLPGFAEIPLQAVTETLLNEGKAT